MDDDDDDVHFLRSMPRSDYVDSRRFSQPGATPMDERDFMQTCDFLNVVTAISKAYSCGEYIPMMALNDVRWDEVAGGSDFLVSRSSFPLAATSLFDQTLRETTRAKLVVKRVRNFQPRQLPHPTDLGLFTRELSILHHLRGHDNVVQLRGVGWTYDCLDDYDLTPCPKPALLVDEATGTLRWLLEQAKDLSLWTEMQICKDVASGLLAVHESGLVHGDIKPDNVLVFKKSRFEEGVEVVHYQCKLSDFSLARVVTSNSCFFEGGTLLYMAPERGYVPSNELHLTDVWSLGVLFASVTERTLDLVSALNDHEHMESMIHKAVQTSIQSSTWHTSISEARQAMFDNTVRQKPRDRHLDRVVQVLEARPELRRSSWDLTKHRLHPGKFVPLKQSEVCISYESFKYTSGQVHDVILFWLKVAATNQHDPRRAQALFELAVIAISGFVRPVEDFQEGLAWLKQSAALLDIRAQGLFYRIEQALDPTAQVTSEIKDWLYMAASQGHEIALQDLRALDTGRAEEAQNRLTECYCAQKTPPLSGSIQASWAHFLQRLTKKAHVNGNSAAEIEIQRLRPCVSVRDLDGNTPLILASKFAAYDLVMELLRLGAHATAVNSTDENFLHFAGNFSSIQLEQIIAAIKDDHHHIVLLQDAKGITMDPFLESFPLTPGTPLERTIASKNDAAVAVLLSKLKERVLANGQVLRRALLLALRLQLVGIQTIILQFMHDSESSWDKTLAPLHKTLWEFKSQKRSYLDAVLVAGISGFGLGADVPLKWWRLCQFGENRNTILCISIEQVLSMAEQVESKEALLDTAIPLAFRERFTDSFQALVEWKARITQGAAQRSPDLVHFTWTSVEAPESFIPIIPILISVYCGVQNYLTGRFWGPEATFGTDLVEKFSHSHPSPMTILKRATALADADKIAGATAAMEELRPWQTMQSENDSGILERPVEVINYVDQIFYDRTLGSLLHQAIRSGDRAMFHLLVHTMGANLSLPAPSVYVGSIVVRQINVYTILAHVTHGDLWFAEQLRGMEVGFNLPYDIIPWSHQLQPTPLFHALRQHQWPYVQWLLRRGANLQHKICIDWDILSFCMAGGELTRDMLEFFVPHRGHGGGSDYLPAELRDMSGFQMFKFLYDCRVARDLKLTWKGDWDNHWIQEARLPGPYIGQTLPHSDDLNEFEHGPPSHDDDCEVPDHSYGKMSYPWRSRTAWRDLAHVYLRHKLRVVHGMIGQRARAESHLLTGALDPANQDVQCWKYLFEKYPQVPDAPSRTGILRFSFPIIMLGHSIGKPFVVRWLLLAIPYPFKELSILQQSLRMSSSESDLFELAISHYQGRAEFRPDTEPFPAQTWVDLLYGSPLDQIPVMLWRRCVLRTRYGYWPSVRNRLLYTPFLCIISLLLGLACVALIWSGFNAYDNLPVGSHAGWRMFKWFLVGLGSMLASIFLSCMAGALGVNCLLETVHRLSDDKDSALTECAIVLPALILGIALAVGYIAGCIALVVQAELRYEA